MSDNKFEKQVQQKLDELKLPPSAGVWQGIENELRGRKRRGFPLWLAAGVLMLAGATYSWYVAVHDHPANDTIAVKEKNNFNKNTTGAEADKENKTISEEGKSSEEKEKSSGAQENTKALPQQFDNNEKSSITSTISREAVNPEKNSEENLSQQQQLISPEASSAAKEKTPFAPGSNPGGKEKLPATGKNISSSEEKDYVRADVPVAEKENELISTSKSKKEKALLRKEKAFSLEDKNDPSEKLRLAANKKPASKENVPAYRPGVISDPEKADHTPVAITPGHLPAVNDEVYAQLYPFTPANSPVPAAGKADLPPVRILKALSDAARKDNVPATALKNSSTAKNKPAGKKWEYGITGGVGSSYINEGSGLSLTKAVVEDVSMASSTVTNSLLIPGPTLALYKPSVLKPSLSYSLGVVVKRSLSKRLAISAGLSYVQYNARTEVGSKIDASQVVNNGPTGYLRVETYYLNAQVQDYKNRYHFIYLPVSAHLKLNRGEKLPVYLNGGMAVSQLISSNSLHFDGTTGVYYSNNSLINKTQADISSGISFVLFNRHSTPLWVGPAFRYNISSLLQKDVSGAKRLIYAGLDLKMYLKR